MKRLGIILLLLIAITAIAVGYWKLTLAPPIVEPSTRREPPATKSESTDDRTRRQLVGVWQDEYKGKRTMTLVDDGSGKMIVELSGLEAFLSAPKLRFNMKWSLDGKALTKTTLSGEPADKVNLILNTMGNTAVDSILEITDERLLLLDKNGATKYDWRRVKDAVK